MSCKYVKRARSNKQPYLYIRHIEREATWAARLANTAATAAEQTKEAAN
jgi:hypothetical protein